MGKITIIFLFLNLAEASSSKYDRKDWKHWVDHNSNCRDTRNEILVARSLRPVIFNKKGCRVVSGHWKDFYYGPEDLFEAKKADLDHLVPLKHAYDSGGAHWSSQKKEQFANDPDNLVITNRHFNRSKGSKGIDSWLPVSKEYACRYIKGWVQIKKKYSLVYATKEVRTIALLRNDCSRLGIHFEIPVTNST